MYPLCHRRWEGYKAGGGCYDQHLALARSLGRLLEKKGGGVRRRLRRAIEGRSSGRSLFPPTTQTSRLHHPELSQESPMENHVREHVPRSALVQKSDGNVVAGSAAKRGRAF